MSTNGPLKYAKDKFRKSALGLNTSKNFKNDKESEAELDSHINLKDIDFNIQGCFKEDDENLLHGLPEESNIEVEDIEMVPNLKVGTKENS